MILLLMATAVVGPSELPPTAIGPANEIFRLGMLRHMT